MGKPAARVADPTTHMGQPLAPGPGSPNTLIGFMPAWRAVPAAAAAALQAAKQAADTAIQVAEQARMAASGTPGAPAALAAETAAKTAAASSLGAAFAAAAGPMGPPDIHMCAMPAAPTPVPHGPGVVLQASMTVVINGLPACRQGDKVIEPIGPPNAIVMGCPTVLIGD